MVVVEGARNRIGERIGVIITGALQNPTGRIVFARLDGVVEPATASETKTETKSDKSETKADNDKPQPRSEARRRRSGKPSSGANPDAANPR